jgi:hypothetical protein
MKYRQLPVETQLLDIEAREGTAAAVEARVRMFLDAARQPGFGFVTLALREIERANLTALRTTTDAMAAQRLLGGIHTIENIRRHLAALLPPAAAPDVDWVDDEAEDYLGAIDDDAPVQGAAR